MAQPVSVRLNRNDNSPWGFRLQGGKDFGQPLLIQKVNGGSLAERAGLQVGDALIKVNNIDVQDLRHKDAQDAIVRAGNSFEVLVQRGGTTTWKPHVSPVGNLPTPGGRSPQTVTKTSLASKQPAGQIPSGHNISPKPFGPSTPQMNGGDSVKAIVNKQYNTPVGMYSEETIAETLSAQAEVLAGGVLGVNFMKNEKTYDSQKSEVFKMVQEVEKEPKDYEAAPLSSSKYFSTTSHAVGGRATSPRPLTPIARQMGTPELPQDKPYMPPQSPLPGNPNCTNCGKLIVGVFVRIKDKNLHAECFKCATCGTSLKNVGYYSINNKLYCDIHAKMVARQNPPAPNLEPVTVPPGGRVPTGTYSMPSVTTNLPSSISSGAPHSPQPGTIAPMPFHSTNSPGPKPFGSQAPPPAPPTSVQFSAPTTNINTPKSQTESKQSITWPPPSKPVEQKDPFHKKSEKPIIKEPFKFESKIPVLSVEDVDEKYDKKKKMSLCSEEVSHISDVKIVSGANSIHECYEDKNRPRSPVPDREVTVSLVNEISKAQVRSKSAEKREITSKQMYEQHSTSKSENIKKISKEDHHMTTTKTMAVAGTSESVTVGGLRRTVSPEILDVSTKPHEIRSLLLPASAVRPLTPEQVVVFPPEIPQIMRSRSCSPQPPAVTELIVTYSASPVQHVTEGKIHSTTKREETSHAKEKKAVEIKEEKTEKKSIKKEKKQEINKSEKIRVEENKEVCKQEIKKKCEEEKVFTKSEVEKIVQEELRKALKVSERKQTTEFTQTSEKSKEIKVTDLPAPIIESGKMASALSVAPDRPFTPVPFPKPLDIPSVEKQKLIKPPVSLQPVPLPPYSKPYFPPPPPPPEHESQHENVARAFREVGCRSPMAEALTIASDRPFSPLPTITKLNQPSSEDNSFKPIAESAKNKKPMTMLTALTVAPTVPFTLPGKTPIPTEPKLDDVIKSKSTPSAFKPLNGSVSCVIPKTAPLNKDLPAPFIPCPKVESKSGLDKSIIQEGGMKKEVTRGYESMSSTSDSARYSRKAEFICESSKSQSQPQKDISHSTTSVKPKPSSGLQCPNILPYYQQNIGEIPVRNKSISPVPHPIKAPSMPPKTPPIRSTITTSATSNKSCTTSAHQRTQNISDKSTSLQKTQNVSDKSSAFHRTQNISGKTCDKRYETSAYSQKSMMSSETSATTRSVTNINKTTQVFKAATPPRQLSPHWRGDYVRSVQNLSPITVRLPSPQPHPAKLVGETSQETGAKIVIKKSKRGQSPVVSYEGDTHCRSSKSVSGKSCTSGKGCSSDDCPSQDCCSNNQGCSKGKVEKHVSGTSLSSSQTSEHTQRTDETYQYQQQQQQLNRMHQKHETQQVQNNHYQQQQQQQQIKQSNVKEYSMQSNYTHDIEAQNRAQLSYSSNNNQNKTSSQATSAMYSKIPKSINNNKFSSISSTSHALCGVNPSSSGGHAGVGAGIGGGSMPGSGKSGTVAGSTAPRRGRGVLNTSVPPGGRIPLCGHCNTQIRGPFITALGKIWCPEHFICVNAKCRRPLQDIGFVEEADGLYCEYCFEQYLAPTCDKCNSKIKGDCLNAIGKHFHPECFRCAYCEKLFGNNPFFLEDALPYCEADWNELFTTKCFSCGFPIEAGDRWVEALSNNYHSQCFNCTMCKKNLEGQSFYAKGGRPYCKNHAR